MDDEDREYLFNWLRDVGEAFLKERLRALVSMSDGEGRLILEYPTMAEARAVALHIEEIKRMAREDARSTAEALTGGSNPAHDP